MKWNIDTPFSLSSSALILTIPQNDTEEQILERSGAGIYEVGIYVQKDHDPGGAIHTRYGKLVWVP